MQIAKTMNALYRTSAVGMALLSLGQDVILKLCLCQEIDDNVQLDFDHLSHVFASHLIAKLL